MTITDILFRPLLTESARPLITYYDDAAGIRVELSRATMANWAAKTANWLVDEEDVEPGQPVGVRLPAHWQTLGVLLGSWWCGAAVTADLDKAAVAFLHPDDPARDAVPGTVALVALDAMGMGLRNPPPGTVDYLNSVRVHGDDYRPAPIPGTTFALADSTVDETVAAARQRATDLGLPTGARLLSTVDWTVPGGILDVLAVLAAGGSLVQCHNADPAKLPHRRTTEHTTYDLLG